MTTTKITIPYKEANRETRQGFEYEVSSILEGGADVQFVDEDGIERNVSLIGAFNNTVGAIKSRGAGRTDAQAVTKKLASGIYHHIQTAFIYSSGTDSSLKIHVKAEE